MKRTVLKFGLMSGAIISLFMLVFTVIGHENIGFDHSMYLGFGSMILALSLVFVGTRSYREQQPGQKLSFGKAFLVGILISLICSACYVITWMFVNHYCYPDFMQQYATYYIEKQRAAGVSGAELELAIAKMEEYKECYKNPFYVAGMTFVEIFPVGVLVSLFAALVLKRK